MKLATLIVSATAGFAAAQAHSHHHHLHKRAPASDNGVVTVYELNGQVISDEQVQEGIKNGTLILDPNSIQPSAAQPAVAAAAVAIPSKAAPAVDVEKVATPKSKPSSSPAPAPVASSSATNSYSSDATGADSEFPSGQIPCSTFPSEYGAINVPWMGLGGWTGVQQPQTIAGGFANIMTMISDLCPPGGCCSEGAYCSYACQPGYQKTQWPSTQGATGQSVGGLLCKNGFLELTNPEMSTSLCMKGTQAVTVQVKNTMSQNAGICRTDYPGTEGETVPLDALPNSLSPLTCPDTDNYYKWQGGSTSAQYYANPKGVAVSDACQWGSPDKPYGNFAPLNLGVGYSNGAAYLSIFQNLPTTSELLDYNVELVGDNGGFDNLIGKCKYFYKTGEYCSGDLYENCSADGKGCTVTVKSGTATYVLSDD